MMRAVLRTCLVIAVMATVTDAFGQARFIPDRTNGVGIAVEGSSRENGTGIAGIFTFTIDGRFDLGVGVEWGDYDPTAQSPELDSFAWGPHLAVALVRPEPQSPLGIEFFGSYAAGTFSGAALDENNLDLSGTTLVLGMEFYFKAMASPDFLLFPSLGLGYGKGTSELGGRYQEPVETEVEDLLVTITVGLQVHRWFTAVPRFMAFDGDVTWSLAVGLVSATN